MRWKMTGKKLAPQAKNPMWCNYHFVCTSCGAKRIVSCSYKDIKFFDYVMKQGCFDCNEDNSDG